MIKGKVVSRLEVQKGTSQAGKEWQKCDFVIETVTNDFTKKVCLTAWGNAVTKVLTLKKGDEIECEYNPESREYNGKWYTTLMVWQITIVSTTGQPTAPPPTPPPPAQEPFRGENETDLPF